MTDERLALRILRRSWSLTDEHETRVGIAVSRYRVRAGSAEPAAVCGANPLRHLVQRVQRNELIAEPVARRLYRESRAGDRWSALSPAVGGAAGRWDGFLRKSTGKCERQRSVTALLASCQALPPSPAAPQPRR